MAGACDASDLVLQRSLVGDGDGLRAVQRPVHAYPPTVQRLHVRPGHQGAASYALFLRTNLTLPDPTLSGAS